MRTKGKESWRPTCSRSSLAQEHGPGAPGGQLGTVVAQNRQRMGEGKGWEAGNLGVVGTARAFCSVNLCTGHSREAVPA